MAAGANTRKSNADGPNIGKNSVLVIEPMTANEMRKALGIKKEHRQTAAKIAKKLQSRANAYAK